MPSQLVARQVAAPINFTIPDNRRLFTCTGQFYGGNCDFQRIETGTCQLLPQEYRNSIRSIRPDPGFNCTVYTERNCAGSSLLLSFPFYDFNTVGFDFGDLPANFDQKLNSYQCVRSGLAPTGVSGGPGTGILGASGGGSGAPACPSA
ncbi:hypothetical protein AX17_003237 [Amanita inopinata Kibby_2008]|nr:hypothetical protein AX17_003237 [Amanita inopinata Kibby_2008]